MMFKKIQIHIPVRRRGDMFFVHSRKWLSTNFSTDYLTSTFQIWIHRTWIYQTICPSFRVKITLFDDNNPSKILPERIRFYTFPGKPIARKLPKLGIFPKHVIGNLESQNCYYGRIRSGYQRSPTDVRRTCARETW